MAAVERAEGAAVQAASGAFKCCGMLYEAIVSGCTLFGGCIKRCPAPFISALLRVLNLGNAVLLGAACYFAFQTVVGPNDVTRTFLAIYCGIFGALLALVRGGLRNSAAHCACPPAPPPPIHTHHTHPRTPSFCTAHHPPPHPPPCTLPRPPV